MKSFIKFLIFAMIIFAFFNVTYNSIKVISEVKEWAPLSDSQKRHKIFGDLYDFLVLVKNHTNNDNSVLIYAKNGDKYQTLFLSIYYLYPQEVTTTVDEKEFNSFIHAKKFHYIAIFNGPMISKEYEKTASFSSQTSANYGSVNKRK